jgi:hypothetical protein
VLRQVTTSNEAPPAWLELSSGAQSLVTLIPDALSLCDQANDVASLTITSRPVGREIGPALPATAVGLDVVAPGEHVSMCLPIGGDHADVWCWAHGYREHFSLEGRETRSRRPALRWAIARIFNDRRVTSEHVDPHSPLLRAVNSLNRRIELWVRPTWRAADLFPLDFAAREAREPVKMPANRRARIREMEEQKARRAKHERQLQVDEKIAADTALWRKDREARRQRQEREAAREQEIQRRVRAEMDN